MEDMYGFIYGEWGKNIKRRDRGNLKELAELLRLLQLLH